MATTVMKALLVGVLFYTSAAGHGPHSSAALDHPTADMFERIGDRFLYQGDMLLSQEQVNDILERKMVESKYFWPRDKQGKLTINYVWGDNKVQKPKIQLALKDWESKTCVHFKEITPKGNEAHLKFVDSCCCRSWVGKQNRDGPHLVEVASNCYPSITNHELGHAMGFHHEHCRTDRDKYIKVFPENAPKNQALNFVKEKTFNYDIPYDYFSVMHYSTMAFSAGKGATIRTLDPKYQQLVGRGQNLSFRDALMFNTAYNCTQEWEKKCPDLLCWYPGYARFDDVKGKCVCVCPPGTSGKMCENLTHTYNEAVLAIGSPDTKVYYSPGPITSVDYPKRKRARLSYTQIITAPECMKAVLTMDDFNVDGRTGVKCDLTYVEIRLNTKPTTGKLYCGTEIKPGTKFVSEGDTILLHFFTYFALHKGYSGKISFQDIPNCKPKGKHGQ